MKNWFDRTDEVLAVPPNAQNLTEIQWKALKGHQQGIDLFEDMESAIVARQSTRFHGTGIPTYEIPSVIAGHFGPLKFKALGDTCAVFNFMSDTCATWLGLNVDKRASRFVTIGSGNRVKTEGTVGADYHFQDEPERSYPMSFHVVPNLVQDIILGRTFLKSTETFTKKSNMLSRVKKTIVRTLKQYRLMYLGDTAPKFLGLLDGTYVDALADTG